MLHSFWMVFLVIYAVAKDLITKLMPKLTLTPVKKLVKTLSIALTLLIMTTTSLFLTPFLIFRTMLYVVLKLKYGERFGGLLKGTDILFELRGESMLMSGIVIYRLNEKEKSKQKEFARKFVKVLHDSMYKLRMNMGTLFGYYYYIKDMVKAEDVLEFVDGDDGNYLTRHALFDFVERNCRAMENNRMWKVNAFLQPINWNDESKSERGEQYAIIVSIRHCVGDGPSILATISKFLVKAGEESEKIGVGVRFIPIQGLKMTLDEVHVHRNPLGQKTEGDMLKIEGNSKWHMATYVEKERKYVAIIKSVKNKLGVSFDNVINAAIYSSILDYVVKRGVKTDKITATTVIRSALQDPSKIKDGIYDLKNISNNHGIITFNIPLRTNGDSMESKILSLNGVRKSLANAVDAILTDVILRYILTYLPISCTELFAEMAVDGATLVTSNMLGLEKSTCFGYPIDDVMLGGAGPLRLGFGCCIFTYDERLSLTISSQRGYVHNRKELQAIVDNVFRYLDQAKVEIL